MTHDGDCDLDHYGDCDFNDDRDKKLKMEIMMLCMGIVTFDGDCHL